MGTISEMVVRITGENEDFFRTISSAEQRAKESTQTFNQIEASAATNAAQTAAVREAQAAASARRTQQAIESAFGIARNNAPAAAASAATAIAHAKQDLGILGSLHEQVAHHAGNHTLAIGRLELALERFSAHALGVNHTLGMVGAGMAKFALGSIETAGILAGLAAVVAIWEHVTGAAREAAKEQEKAITSFEKLQKARALGPQGETILAINERIEAARKALEANQALIEAARAPATGISASGTVNPFATHDEGIQISAAIAARHVEEARKQQKRLTEDLRQAEAERAVILQQAALQTNNTYAQNLAALIHYNEKDKEARANALMLMKAWQETLAKLPGADVAGRANLIGDITTLHNALFPKSEAHDAERAEAARISGLITEMENLRERGQAYGAVMTKLLDIYGGLGDGAKRLNETWEQFQNRSQHIHSILSAIRGIVKDIHVPDIKGPDIDVTKPFDFESFLHPAGAAPPSMFRALDQQVAAARLAQQQLELTNMMRASQGQKPLDNAEVMAEHQRALLESAQELRRVLNSTGLDPRITTELMDELLNKLRSAGVLTDELKKKLQDIADVADAFSAAGGLAGALGAGDLAQTLGNISNVVFSVGSAAAQGWKNPSADIQAATSVVSAVRGLFDSPLHREQLQLMRENNQRLYDVALRLQGFQTNAANTVSAGQAAQAALAGGAGAGIGLGSLFGNLQVQIDALTPYLKAVGLSWLQFAQIAKDSGINIFDSHGRIVVGALEQFAKAAHDAAQAAFTFTSSFSDRQALINIQDALAGRLTEADRMAAMLQAIQAAAPGLLPSNATTGTIEGRDALREALQGIINGIAAGTIDPSQFGSFQNLQEFLGALNPLIEAMNQLTSATVATTTALVNVPPTFKYAQFAFDAAMGDALGVGDNGIKRPTPIADMNPFSGGSAGAGGVNITVGALHIAADPAAAPLEEQADAFLNILGHRALATFGDAMRWSELRPLS